MYRKLIAVLALSGMAPALATQIDRVEPPSWWRGFDDTTLQLMVYGDGIGSFTPSIEYAGVDIRRVTRVANPNYLFVYLQLDPDAPAGDFEIVFADEEQRLTHRYTLHQKNTDPEHARGYDNSDAIYLITPDRFANGNPDNDNIGALGDPVNRDGWQDRHGGDIAGMKRHLDYIADMGFTAVWLNPVLENAMPRTSYHGYATTDFYNVDPRFGSNAEYRDFVVTARERGIGTIMDMIANHAGREHWWMSDMPSPDWINNGGVFVNTSHERTAVHDPYAAEADLRAFADGWFVEAMPDLNQRNPLLADYLIQNSLWWIEYLGLAGIRQDTYPYPDAQFMSDWTRRIMREYPQFNIVGEQWSTDPIVVAYWQRGKQNPDGYVSYLPGLMDFPLQDALRRALTGDDSWHSSMVEIYRMLANDIVYADPMQLVIFADNHDMSRIYTQLGEGYGLWKIAMAFLATTRGIPQFYYGTEILMANRESEDHGLIRSDFPGGWHGDRVNAFSGRGLTRQQKQAQDYLRRLLNWRKSQAAVHYGELTHYSPLDGVYVYFRYDDSDKVMVVLNKNDRVVDLDLARFDQMLGGHAAAHDVIADRRFELARRLRVGARDALVLELR